MQTRSRTKSSGDLSNLTNASSLDEDTKVDEAFESEADRKTIPRTILAWAKGCWHRFYNWLQRVPVEDPVDRRNAAFMQVFLVYLACKTLPYKLYLLLFNSNYQILFSGEKWAKAPPFPLVYDLGTDLMTVISAMVGVYLIRKGAFRQAVIQFVVVMLLTMLIAFGGLGYRVWHRGMVEFILFVLTGFMIGRKALWSTYLAMIVIGVIGMTTDYFRLPQVLHSISAYNLLPTLILYYFVAALIIDRTGTAFRRSLAESNQRQKQLQLEMARREQVQEQLLHAQKMDVVGKLSSGVAHDFNNVLGIIQGFTSERHRLDEPEAVRDTDALALADALEGVEMAARRGTSISRKLLNFSRQEVTHTETFDVNQSLRELEPLLHQMLPASIRLQVQTSAGLLPIDFDRSQLELALLNLTSNARDAMPDGGKLSLSATTDDASRVCITVQDNGIGMTEDVRQHIFEPFYTTKPTDKGTGLGLTVIHDLVERAGGSIKVDSSPSAGTTFDIRLPMAQHTITDDPFIPATPA